MKQLTLLAVALASLASTPALAASSASATFGPLSVQLVDINPFDNVTPSITWSNTSFGEPPYWASGFADVQYFVLNAYPPVYTYPVDGSVVFASSSPWTAASGSAASGTGIATLSFGAGAADGNGATVSASGSVGDFVGIPDEFGMFRAASISPDLYWSYNQFTLSANTAVYFSGVASVAAATTRFLNYPDYVDYAYASVSLNAEGFGGDIGGGGSGYYQSSDSVKVDTGTPVYGGPFNLADSRTLTARFFNFTSADLSGRFYVVSEVKGYSTTTPVPEPESYALMLAGLLTIYFVRRRRP